MSVPTGQQRLVAPYGAWPSVVGADLVASSETALSDVRIDGDDILWVEGRPREGGRDTIVRAHADGRVSDVVPATVNARSSVHEYGGAAYCVDGGNVWYSDLSDGRLWEVVDGSSPRPLTPEGAWRYADLVHDAVRRRLVCIREDHTAEALAVNGEAVNALVAVREDGTGVDVLVAGNDFYMAPRLSPDGRRLAWLTWSHPRMPWDGTELWVAELDEEGMIRDPRCVAGGANESVLQPRWSPAGVLHFISDRSGWWNLERSSGVGRLPRRETIAPMEADFAGPDWWLGLSTYGITADRTILAVIRTPAGDRVLSIDGETLERTWLDLPFVEIKYVDVRGRVAAFVASSLGAPAAVVALDLESGMVRTVAGPWTFPIDGSWISASEPISYPTGSGRTAHGLYYRPVNPEATAPEGTLPPLIVHVHGGPTLCAGHGFDVSIQFFTSRGFAYLDVNYGGSTGYGRAYRQQLVGQWGVVDVDDCASGALYLADRGLVDRTRLAIMGGSAGGFTTCASLAFRDVFAVGVSLFGITDLAAWARDTHKFESHYLDTMIGPYPEAADLYVTRSPTHAAGHIGQPLLLIQGLADTIVPPSQAELMVVAGRAAGRDFRCMGFEGEGHGFRRATSIREALDAELDFFREAFGLARFVHGDSVEVPVGSP